MRLLDEDRFVQSGTDRCSKKATKPVAQAMDADIEFTAVPEPAAAALLISLSCFTLSVLRRRPRK